MNIKSIKTRQFAGIKNKKVELNDGLNVLVGKNEAGKSTMIELIYQILYRGAKLNKTKDKDFFTRFMPSDSDGDVVDGTLVFATKGGEYTLSKKWGASTVCEIESPNGAIVSNEDKICEIIAGELIYKKGLYDDVVFASQKQQADIVQHILKKLDKNATTKQDLVSIIASEGMSSTGGIAPEDIERVLREKIDELLGNWDIEKNSPKNNRGINNQFTRGNGRIITSYYALETLKERLRNSETIEKAIDNDNNKILEAKEKLKEYKNEKEEYERYSGILAAYNSNMKLKEKYSKERNDFLEDLEVFPGLIESYGDALRLSTLVEAERVIDKYNKIQEAKKKLDDAKNNLEGKSNISSENVCELEALEKTINDLQAKLSNLELVANIKKLGNTDIQVKSVATGKTLDIASGEFDINETVEIMIPGIMSMTIAGKGVDVEAVQSQLAKTIEKRKALLSKYNSIDLNDLRSKMKDYEEASSDVSDANQVYGSLIDGVDTDKLKDDYSNYKDKKSELEGLDEKIESLCGTESVGSFLARQDQEIKSMKKKYGEENTLDNIKKKLEDVNLELDKLASVEDEASQIPEKYLAIDDVETYRTDLNENIKATENQIEEVKNILDGHKNEINKILGNNTPDDLRLQIDDANDEFEKYKDDYRRWTHILTVLKDTRNNMASESTMSDVQQRFADYLSVITDGRIVLESMDENMDVDIKSGDNHLNYEILSEGTKNTIALAFRLAMLEHLFPEGGGLVVFDDPFTEMDEDRTKQACKLVQKFADAGNQVIFVTCDNKYKQLLYGNVVEM